MLGKRWANPALPQLEVATQAGEGHAPVAGAAAFPDKAGGHSWVGEGRLSPLGPDLWVDPHGLTQGPSPRQRAGAEGSTVDASPVPLSWGKGTKSAPAPEPPAAAWLA